ncbi:MAG: hydrogenase 3 maturation endopeptidase HyCI [bacterium]|nr:hydrogenase 3 maturation endopeptidase HyCI [bacterium]
MGSDLRGDDAAGMILCRRLEARFASLQDPSLFRVFMGETAPENLTGEIRRFAPSHLIIVDSADFGREPGSVVAADPVEITGISFSTHRLPLFVLTDYIEREMPCRILIIGIQPGTLGLFREVSGPVADSLDTLSETLIKSIESLPGFSCTLTR